MLVLAHANLLTNRYLATDDVVVVLRRFVAKHAVVGDTIAFLEAARAGLVERVATRRSEAGANTAVRPTRVRPRPTRAPSMWSLY